MLPKVPTSLGIALITALRACDPGLVEPDLRASIERSVEAIAAGEAKKEARALPTSSRWTFLVIEGACAMDRNFAAGCLQMVLADGLALFRQKYGRLAAPAQFDRKVRPLFVSEAAADGLAAASITARQELKGAGRRLRLLGDGQIAKAEAEADVAAAAAVFHESARMEEGRERGRAALLTSNDACNQIHGALFG